MSVALLVTRPEADAERTAARLTALDIVPVLAPMLERVDLPFDPPAPEGLSGIVLTSANGVRALGPDLVAQLRHLDVFAVGDHTALAAREAGFIAVTSADGALADLVETITRSGITGRLFYPAGRDRSGDLEALLAPAGITLETVPVYAMEPATRFATGVLPRLVGGEIAGALFYSARTAKAFARLTEGRDFDLLRAELECLCLSEAVAAPLVGARHMRLSLADHPSEEAMMALALAFAREQIRP